MHRACGDLGMRDSTLENSWYKVIMFAEKPAGWRGMSKEERNYALGQLNCEGLEGHQRVFDSDSVVGDHWLLC